MASAFPSALDTHATRSTGQTIEAAHVNDLQDQVRALEAKLGVDSTVVTTSIDYKLKATASVDPGHKHSDTSLNSLAHTKLAYTGLTSGHALVASGATAASFRALVETDIANGSLLARVNDTETVAGAWTFNGTKPKFQQGIELRGAGAESVSHTAAVGAGTVSYAWPSAFTNGYYLQVGAGGALTWAAAAGGGGGGWQDDGTVVRPIALTDQVAIGTATPVALTRLHVNAQTSSDILILARHAATPLASWLQLRRSDDGIALEFTSAEVLKLKNTQSLVLATASAGALFGYSNASSGYLGIACDSEANLLTGNQLAAKFFSDTTVFFGTLAASQGTSGAQFTVRSGAVGRIGLIARAMTAQTANLQEWQSSVPATLGSVTVAGLLSMPNIGITGGGTLKLYGGTSGFSGFTAAPSGANVTYTLPAADGSNGQVLGTNGAGGLSWVSGGGGGSAALSGLLAATGGNTINSTTFAQVWQWALGTSGNFGLTLTESVAATTGGIFKTTGITTSTAVVAEIGHADVGGRSLYVNSGKIRLKANYIALGPAAAWLDENPGGDNQDVAVRFQGDISPKASYATTTRWSAIGTGDMEMVMPVTPPTNISAGPVYFGLHSKFRGLGASNGSWNNRTMYGLDLTIDIGANFQQMANLIVCGSELNFNNPVDYADVAALYLCSINTWTASTGNTPALAMLWLRPQTGMALGTQFLHPGNSNGTKILYGILTPSMSSTNWTDEKQWRPFYINGAQGISMHGPRLLLGTSVFTNLSWDYIGSSGLGYGAALVVTGQASGARVAGGEDKFIVFMSDSTGLNSGRAAFYRSGGMWLKPVSAAPDAVEGALYGDIDDHKLYYYDGTGWVNLSDATAGGGGFADDGTTVRLSTASDKVVLGASTSALLASLCIEINATTGERHAIAIKRKDSYAGSALRYTKEDGTTLLASIGVDGAIVGSAYQYWQHTDATIKGVMNCYSTGVALWLGDSGALEAGAAARNYISIKNGVAPSSSPTDAAVLYAKDAAAGKSWLMFRAEDAVERVILGIETTNTSVSSGAGSVKLTGSTARDNVGWMKTHDHAGNIIYVPYWTTIT